MLVLFALGCLSGAYAGDARTLAEELSKLQQVAFEDPAAGDAIIRSLRPSFLQKGSQYPFAKQTAFQASSPASININFDMPRSSFVQRQHVATQDSDPIGSLMKNYAQIGQIMGKYASEVPSDSDIRDMVGRANSDDASDSGCANCAQSLQKTEVSSTKPVLEVRLAAPKIAPWHSLISGLVKQREQMESKYMTMFRGLFERQFAEAHKSSSYLQKSGEDSLNVKVGALHEVEPELAALVVAEESKRNQQEMSMLQSAISALQAMSGNARVGRHSFVEKAEADFDIKIGEGSRPFVSVRRNFPSGSTRRSKNHVSCMTVSVFLERKKKTMNFHVFAFASIYFLFIID